MLQPLPILGSGWADAALASVSLAVDQVWTIAPTSRGQPRYLCRSDYKSAHNPVRRPKPCVQVRILPGAPTTHQAECGADSVDLIANINRLHGQIPLGPDDKAFALLVALLMRLTAFVNGHREPATSNSVTQFDRAVYTATARTNRLPHSRSP